MEPARDVLAELLQRVDSRPEPDLLLEAAALANRLALFHGDASLTDVAEGLAAELPPGAPTHVARALRREAELARTTRRAIAQSHRERALRPREVLETFAAAHPEP